ncbi:hypothetical protein B0H13DRAFT_2283269 [Mycena leptocephala]|nr:hypothetical protein B0H13DRAFT_2283269 [Mycena leptocephala]
MIAYLKFQSGHGNPLFVSGMAMLHPRCQNSPLLDTSTDKGGRNNEPPNSSIGPELVEKESKRVCGVKKLIASPSGTTSNTTQHLIRPSVNLQIGYGPPLGVAFRPAWPNFAHPGPDKLINAKWPTNLGGQVGGLKYPHQYPTHEISSHASNARNEAGTDPVAVARNEAGRDPVAVVRVSILGYLEGCRNCRGRKGGGDDASKKKASPARDMEERPRVMHLRTPMIPLGHPRARYKAPSPPPAYVGRDASRVHYWHASAMFPLLTRARVAVDVLAEADRHLPMSDSGDVELGLDAPQMSARQQPRFRAAKHLTKTRRSGIRLESRHKGPWAADEGHAFGGLRVHYRIQT